MQIVSSELFTAGAVIREPVGSGPGYWVGAPGAYFAADENAWYLTYRLRRPRGVQPDRGGEARIARSTDLTHWKDIWAVTKDRYDSPSIERSCIHKGRDGHWRYFTSYVDPADGRWCTAVLKGNSVETLDPAKRSVIFTAASLDLEGVKDPWIIEIDGVYHLFLSIAVRTPTTQEGSHATLDIFNTGECKSATGLATSGDLDHWEWQGVIFAPTGSGWDRYCRRINSVIQWKGRYLAFYDGSASHLENYEEKTGFAVSDDLRSWQCVTPNGPALTSRHGSTSLRYIDARIVEGQTHFFYETARADGAHEMRFAKSKFPQ
jgi:hypothetical protein